LRAFVATARPEAVRNLPSRFPKEPEQHVPGSAPKIPTTWFMLFSYGGEPETLNEKLVELTGIELETSCGRLSPQAKSRASHSARGTRISNQSDESWWS